MGASWLLPRRHGRFLGFSLVSTKEAWYFSTCNQRSLGIPRFNQRSMVVSWLLARRNRQRSLVIFPPATKEVWLFLVLPKKHGFFWTYKEAWTSLDSSIKLGRSSASPNRAWAFSRSRHGFSGAIRSKFLTPSPDSTRTNA